MGRQRGWSPLRDAVKALLWLMRCIVNVVVVAVVIIIILVATATSAKHVHVRALVRRCVRPNAVCRRGLYVGVRVCTCDGKGTQQATRAATEEAHECGCDYECVCLHESE